MPEIFEFGIVGMGPSGIGMAMSLCGTSNNMKNTICFERGSYPNEKICSAFLQNECCYSNVCTVISGIGGASTLSSGKISNFPAGSGLIEFFDSEQQLKELLNEIIFFFSNKIVLKKVEIDSEIKKMHGNFMNSDKSSINIMMFTSLMGRTIEILYKKPFKNLKIKDFKYLITQQL